MKVLWAAQKKDSKRFTEPSLNLPWTFSEPSAEPNVNLQEPLEPSLNLPWAFPGPSATFKNLQELSQTFKNLQEPSETFKNIQEHSRTFKNIQEPSKTFMNLQKPSYKLEFQIAHIHTDIGTSRAASSKLKKTKS